jgi:uridine kinase
MMDVSPLSLTKQVSDISTLAQNRLFGRLSVQELGILIDTLDQVALPAGAAVMSEGEDGEFAYIVLDGTAVERRGALEVATLGPGANFGELSLVGVLRRTSTVETRTPMRLARLSRTRFAGLTERHPELGARVTGALAATLAADLAQMTDRVGVLLRERSVARRATVTVVLPGGERRTVTTTTRIGELLPREVDGVRVVGALLDDRPVSLDVAIVNDARVAPLTLASWDGRDILRRSVGLLLLEAAHRIAPGVIFRLGASLTSGRVVHVDAPDGDTPGLAVRLGRAMEALVLEGASFREELWSVAEARAHFVAAGWLDAAALLGTWRDSTVSLVSCGEVYALAEGPLLASARELEGFSVGPHPEGLLLDFGQTVKKHVVAQTLSMERIKPRFGGEMMTEEKRWLASLGVTSVGTFNAQCVTGSVKELIRVSEGFHEKRVSRIADAIDARRRDVKIITIAGPSSSGKTTFIKRLTTQLEIIGLRPVSISLDDYYVDRERTVKDASGEYDFEALEALDLALVRDHTTRLLAGEEVATARFDFLAGKSLPSGGPTITLGEGRVLLFEGIHGLNPELLGTAVPQSAVFRVFVHPATSLAFDRLSSVATADVRLLRRLVRDRHHRGYRAEETIHRWASVRRGETLHILPFQSFADAVFNTSLVYELSVLKVFADRYLLEVPAGDPAFSTAYRLRRVLDRFVTIYPDHVPPTSILREFIGGSGFEY